MSTEPKSDQGLVLIVDDDELVQRAVGRSVRARGYQVRLVGTAEEAAVILRQEPIDVVLTDVHLPGMSGMELLSRGQRIRPSAVFMVFTGMGDLQTAYSCLELGAADYFEKPIEDWPRFFTVLRRSVDFARLREENAQLKQGGELFGNSQAMVDLRARINQIGRSSATVLIQGESGTGKELVARELHRASGRTGAFTAINCAAIPSALIESELFGHVRGAHSTAADDRLGLLRAADEGTLLLDEIGDMPLELQAKLLRVLESRRFRPVGGDSELPLTARILAASHRDLREAVKSGSFRGDLLYRLDVVTLQVPPLREREGDVALLTYRFARDFAGADARTIERVDPEAMHLLEAYPWPGNVRELRNALHRAVLLCTDGVIRARDLPIRRADPRDASGTAPDAGDAFSAFFDMPYAEAKEAVVEAFTVRYLERLVERYGSVTAAADKAGMARPNLSRLLKRFGIAGR
jgi:two-component system response regulator AtoC